MKGTPEEYAKAFETFIRCTDEKKVFLGVLREKISKDGIGSVLDIGAGNGDLAIPISKLVRRYVAIEPVSKYAARLKENGITVIESFFPCDIRETFDLALISHSLPWKPEKYEPFLLEAAKLLKERGEILAITYDDGIGDWHEMLKNCDLPSKRRITGHIDTLSAFIRASFSNFIRKDLITTITSKSLDEALSALAFVYSDGEPSHFKEFVDSTIVQRYLRERYWTEEKGFSFPLTHIFLSIRA